MTARILDGKAVAGAVLSELDSHVRRLDHAGIQVRLVYVSAGSSEAGEVYLRRLSSLARRHGIVVDAVILPELVSVATLENEIRALSDDDTVDGVLIESPLPEHLRDADVSRTLDPAKDVDGVTIENAGRLYAGRPAMVPSTAAAMMEILAHYEIEPTGKRAVVVGRSRIVGHPAAELLLHHHATVTVAHSRTRDLASVISEAEILFAAVGRPRLITGDMIRPGAIIVDAGINVVDGQLTGDVDFASSVLTAEAITPVPGGVGPVTNAVLLRSLVRAAEARRSNLAGSAVRE